MGSKNQRINQNFSKSEFFSHDRADAQLKYIIGVLQGKHIICSRKGRIQLALVTKELLKDHHFEWHCERVDNWIHRTSKLEQNPKDSDLSKEREREEDSLNKPQKRVIKFIGDLYK